MDATASPLAWYEPAAPAAAAAPPAELASRRPAPDAWPARHPRLLAAAVVVAVWAVLGVGLAGRWTLDRPVTDYSALHLWLNDVRDAVGRARADGSALLAVTDAVRSGVAAVVAGLQHLLSQPPPGRPVPELGWLGVVAVVTWLAALAGTWRTAAVAAGGLLGVGALGLWTPSMDTLALTLAAVAIGLAVGVPLGVLLGLSDRATRLVTPLLDVAQTMPAFVYLAPLTLFFLIGPASATIVTVVYALPPAVRLTAHGLRGADPACVEAATSVGATGAQRLRWVLLPLARRSIALGANQTIMAALSMVTVAALVDAPGLGKEVLRALESLDVGRAFTAGLAIVVLAVVLDRVTTAAVDASDRRRHRGRTARRARAAGLAAGAVAALVAVALSRTYLWAATFPEQVDAGPAVRRAADAVAQWATGASSVTTAVKDGVSAGVLDPLEHLLAGTPWFVVAAALVALAVLAAGVRAGVLTGGCVALLLGTGLWAASMRTLAATLVATAVVVAVGVVAGVWAGRDARAFAVLRPGLDAAQTMPAFVYLVPFVALFGVGRFTAVAAAVVYATPVAVRVVAAGVRAVPATTVEAARAAGCTTWQVVTAVQLPLSTRALTLALNQGLVYVLSMVVVGALVGAGALGYDVVAGFSQGELYGRGLAAGVAIVVLGIGLDRVTRAAAARRARPGLL